MVSTVGDVWAGRALPQRQRSGKAEAAECELDSNADRACAERNYLDRDGEGAERRHLLAGIAEDDHSLRGGSNNLLAEHGAAAALDQAKLRIDFVGTVDREVEDRLGVEGRQRHADLA